MNHNGPGADGAELRFLREAFPREGSVLEQRPKLSNPSVSYPITGRAKEAGTVPADAVVLEDVWKRYSNGTEALRGLSLSIHRGEIFCLLGPNGSGKTTSLRVLATQLMPTLGKVSIFGVDAVADAPSIRHHLAVVPQDAHPAFDLSPFEQIVFCLRARGQGAREAQTAADEALEMLGFADLRKVITAKLSGGYRRRVLIALAIASKADVLLLDEPTTGLDPAARRQLWQDLVRLKAGRAVLLTSHSMEESEALADFVGIVYQGKMAGLGTVPELRRKLRVQSKIRFEDASDAEIFSRFGSVERYGGKCLLYPLSDEVIEEVVRLAVREHIPFSVLPTDLEDVYFHLVRDNI